MRFTDFEIDFCGRPIHLYSGSLIIKEQSESGQHKISLHDGCARFEKVPGSGEICDRINFRCLKAEIRDCTVTVYSFDKNEIFPLPEMALGWVLSKLPPNMSADFFKAVEQNAFDHGMVVAKSKMQNALRDIIGIG